MSSSIAWNIKAKASCEKSPSHLRKGEKKQRAAPISIDSPNSREGKKEVDQTKAPGGKECLRIISTGALEEHKIVNFFLLFIFACKFCE